MILQMMKKKSN